MGRMEISASTATFIPILPIYLEVLNNFNFSKKSRKASMKPLDFSCIQAWEAQVARDGTPLLAFYKSWKKVADVQQAKKVADQEKISDFSHIPALKKNHKKLRMKREMEEEVEGGFLSGSDDDFDDEENFKLKEERGKKRTATMKVMKTK